MALKQMLTVVDKFPTVELFIGYAKQMSGYSFDEPAMTEWYNNNQDFSITYTGMIKELSPFVTGVLIPAKQNQPEE